MALSQLKFKVHKKQYLNMDKSKILKIVLVIGILATLVYMVQKWKQTVNLVQDTQQEIREKE